MGIKTNLKYCRPEFKRQSIGGRELIATVVSQGNECTFCTAAHTAIAEIFLDDNSDSIVEKVKADIVDGLASVTPSEPAFYHRLGKILKDKGYLPSENRYAER